MSEKGKELAVSMMRRPLYDRLTDRGFVVPVIGCIAVWIVAGFGHIEFEQAVNATVVLAGGFTAFEKIKDAILGSAALRSVAPDTLNVGSAQTVNAERGESTPAGFVDVELPSDADWYGDSEPGALQDGLVIDELLPPPIPADGDPNEAEVIAQERAFNANP